LRSWSAKFANAVRVADTSDAANPFGTMAMVADQGLEELASRLVELDFTGHRTDERSSWHAGGPVSGRCSRRS
jgi:hypothetical protein